ncbi:hypothetical protein HGP16_33095 [Rhizobium sp. P40RR-XXII]|uniref:hypothetical protein n=1 Tax=unclassified Rhizobium TaxID=2613769 RepID=UPI00145718A7|nr:MULTISPECIES: hypothetical protein [unclassified Rhizobium]NLR88314.1 hypothetical protein [Rhizobium sp. P28RR-XV]NLS21331.1 hypothetical protein [Rhizobium sp. P40RR-XXII]
MDPGGWQNIKLGDFLEAMSAWATDWQMPADTNQHDGNLTRAGSACRKPQHLSQMSHG